MSTPVHDRDDDDFPRLVSLEKEHAVRKAPQERTTRPPSHDRIQRRRADDARQHGFESAQELAPRPTLGASYQS